jgi:hypothetical protein
MTKRLTKLKERADVYNTRVDDEEQRIAELERKRRTRELIETGGLVWKGGAGSWPKERVLGLVLAAVEHNDRAAFSRWEARGAAALNPASRVPATAKFKAGIDASASEALAKAGFKFNKLREEWEGRVVEADAATLVRTLGGEFKLLP